MGWGTAALAIITGIVGAEFLEEYKGGQTRPATAFNQQAANRITDNSTRMADLSSADKCVWRKMQIVDLGNGVTVGPLIGPDGKAGSRPLSNSQINDFIDTCENQTGGVVRSFQYDGGPASVRLQP